MEIEIDESILYRYLSVRAAISPFSQNRSPVVGTNHTNFRVVLFPKRDCGSKGIKYHLISELQTAQEPRQLTHNRARRSIIKPPGSQGTFRLSSAADSLFLLFVHVVSFYGLFLFSEFPGVSYFARRGDVFLRFLFFFFFGRPGTCRYLSHRFCYNNSSSSSNSSSSNLRVHC